MTWNPTTSELPIYILDVWCLASHLLTIQNITIKLE